MSTHHKRGGFSIDYATTGRSTCKLCYNTIAAGSLRVAEEVRSEYHDGWDKSYKHLRCVRLRDITQLRHYETLRWDDQMKIRKKFNGGKAVKEDAAMKELHRVSERVWEMNDDIADNMKNKEIKELLLANGMTFGKASIPWLRHRLADAMAFGRPGLCPECKSDALYHNTVEWVCKGSISEYTNCEFHGNNPNIKRYAFEIPAAMAKKNKWLKGWKPAKDVPKEKFVPPAAEDDDESASLSAEGAPASASSTQPTQSMDVEGEDWEEAGAAAGAEEDLPVGQELYGMSIALAGGKAVLGRTAKELSSLIEEHGGSVAKSVTESTSALVTGESEIKKKKPQVKVRKAKELGVPVLSVEWLQNLVKRDAEGTQLRSLETAKTYLLGEEPEGLEERRFARKYRKRGAEEAGLRSSSSTNAYREKPVPGSDVLAVDPDADVSGGEILVTHDAKHGYTPYNATLNQTDISQGINKYYRVQVIKKGKRYHVFMSWGRIGVGAVGGTSIKRFGSEQKAIDLFVEKWEKFTGARWSRRHRYKKKPKAYQWVKLDDGLKALEKAKSEAAAAAAKKAKQPSKKKAKSNSSGGAKKKLDARVAKLINLIFDKDMMEKALLKFEVDLKKMPLGNISKTQITDGYKTLSEIADLLQAGGTPSRARLIDYSNRFYTLIPHDFGRRSPPIIDSIEEVKKKMQLIEALEDIEVATTLVENEEEDEDPLMNHYRALKAELVPVPKDSERYKLLETYAHRGHDSSYFGHFTPKVLDILEIKRQDADRNFAKWKDNDHRMLLWHGSRLTNWVGIISQGLRIAPPEAPKTGYRFGKGIYLASCVSKSVSYCGTDKNSPTGVMLLAEAALGREKLLKKDRYMEKPMPGSDSTHALGMSTPNPKQTVTLEDGVVVPCGAPSSSGLHTACSHDEYIVYSVEQVRMRYVFIIDVTWKGNRWGW